MVCAGCGREFTGPPKARFCSDVECKRARERARKRASRAGSSVRPAQVVVLPRPALSGVPSAYEATLEVLTSVNRQVTPAGVNALALAARLDSSTSDTGSSLAALSKQHLAALGEALKDAPREADGVDELRQQRLRRLGLA